MKLFNRNICIDDSLFILVLALPCILAVAVDVNSVAEKVTVIAARHPEQNPDAKFLAQAKSDSPNSGGNVH
jgi:hypothetical protein